MERRMYTCLVYILLLVKTMGYEWPLDAVYHDAKITFSESYMYGSNRGPWPVSAGNSYIELDFDFEVRGFKPESDLKVKAAVIYSKELVNIDADDFEFCREEPPKVPKYVKSTDVFAVTMPKVVETAIPTSVPVHSAPSPTSAPVYSAPSPTSAPVLFVSTGAPTVGESLNGNSTMVSFAHRFSVDQTGLQTLILEVCSSDKSIEMIFTGTLGFRNPYGWLPARFFGFMPFEFARGSGFMALLLMLIALISRHSADDNVIGIHYALLFVIALGAAEAWSWFFSYFYLNATGVPSCYPFPRFIIASMTLSAVEQTAARTLLLTVAMGLGLVKISFSMRTTFIIIGLSAAYLASSIAVEANKIVTHHKLDDGHRKNDDDRREAAAQSQATLNAWIDAPQLIFDLIFLIWIYLSLCTTTEVLRAQNQTYKLLMFQQLNCVIAAFVLIATILTGVYLAGTLGLLSWPWKLDWLQAVSIEILNFAVLAAISIIWRPTDRTKLLIMHDQISTNDFDHELDDDLVDENNDDAYDSGIELRAGPRANASARSTMV